MFTLEISITHNKHRNAISYLLINCISAGSAYQILFLKDEYTLRFSNVLVIGLYNSPANYVFDIVLHFIVPPEMLAPGDFLSKNL